MVRYLVSKKKFDPKICKKKHVCRRLQKILCGQTVTEQVLVFSFIMFYKNAINARSEQRFKEGAKYVGHEGLLTQLRVVPSTQVVIF